MIMMMMIMMIMIIIIIIIIIISGGDRCCFKRIARKNRPVTRDIIITITTTYMCLSKNIGLLLPLEPNIILDLPFPI
jgi:ABC-type Fe3+ transport system substrate-binding protein